MGIDNKIQWRHMVFPERWLSDLSFNKTMEGKNSSRQLHERGERRLTIEEAL
jgi:hypothetical protein